MIERGMAAGALPYSLPSFLIHSNFLGFSGPQAASVKWPWVYSVARWIVAPILLVWTRELCTRDTFLS